MNATLLFMQLMAIAGQNKNQEKVRPCCYYPNKVGLTARDKQAIKQILTWYAKENRSQYDPDSISDLNKDKVYSQK